MSKKIFVYSTMSASVRYCAAIEGGADMPVPQDGIVIKGGTGVANKNLITPSGAVATQVTSEQLEQLRQDRVFNEHLKNGYLLISDDQKDGEAAASDMESRDNSAPLTPEDYEAVGDVAPKVGIPTDGDEDDKAPRKNSRRA